MLYIYIYIMYTYDIHISMPIRNALYRVPGPHPAACVGAVKLLISGRSVQLPLTLPMRTTRTMLMMMLVLTTTTFHPLYSVWR